MTRRKGVDRIFIPMYMNPCTSRSFGLSLGVLLFAALAGGLPAAGADDHGDTPETATPVVIGVTTSGQHEIAGDTDFFSFDATQSQYYRIETFDLESFPGGSQSDTVIYLYDSDGQTVLAADDQSGSQLNASKILWGCSRTDTYYLEIIQFFSTATGMYKFIIDPIFLPPDDHSNYPDEAATALVIDGTPTGGTIEVQGDVDFFAYPAEVGLFYDVETFDLSTSSDTLLALYSPDGMDKFLEDDQGGRQTNASRMIWKATETARFFVRVSQYLTAGTGDYSVGVREEGIASLIPALFVEGGTPVSGLLPEAGDIDVHSFEAGEKHFYEIALETANGQNNFELALLDTNGMTILAENDFSESNLNWQAPADGLYFLIVREDLQGGSYDLSVWDQGTPPADADLNDDFKVDHSDLYLFQAEWQKVYPTPTPGS